MCKNRGRIKTVAKGKYDVEREEILIRIIIISPFILPLGGAVHLELIVFSLWIRYQETCRVNKCKSM